MHLLRHYTSRPTFPTFPTFPTLGRYSSAKLSCMHANGADKQKTPGVCLVRQLLKANGFRMVSQTESLGYEGSGRKIVRRWYLVVDWGEPAS